MNKGSSVRVAVGSAILLSSGFWLSPASAGQLFNTNNWRDLNFEQSGNNTDLSAGSIIGEQWSDWGLSLSAESFRNNGRHSHLEDTLTLYDSASRNGKDIDLETGLAGSGYAEGNLLIIQENEKGWHDNLRRDGTLKHPDDEAKGGSITFDFFESVDGSLRNDGSAYAGVELGKIRLIDIDQNPTLRKVSFDIFSTSGEVVSWTAAALNSGDGNSNFAEQLFRGVESTHEGEVGYHGENSIWEFDLGAAYRQALLQNNPDSLDYAVASLKVNYEGSGAIAGLSWDEIREGDEPELAEEVPEPTALTALGIVAVGTLKMKRKLIA